MATELVETNLGWRIAVLVTMLRQLFERSVRLYWQTFNDAFRVVTITVMLFLLLVIIPTSSASDAMSHSLDSLIVAARMQRAYSPEAIAILDHPRS